MTTPRPTELLPERPKTMVCAAGLAAPRSGAGQAVLFSAVGRRPAVRVQDEIRAMHGMRNGEGVVDMNIPTYDQQGNATRTWWQNKSKNQ
jgi:hypothetical protein